MLPEFQKTLNIKLHEKKNTFTFFADILVVAKGTKKEHMDTVEETIIVLDEAGIQLRIEKGQIALENTEWLGYKLSAEGIKLSEGKVQAITNKLRPKNL